MGLENDRRLVALGQMVSDELLIPSSEAVSGPLVCSGRQPVRGTFSVRVMSRAKSASYGLGWVGPARASGKTATGSPTHCGPVCLEASRGVVADVGPADVLAAAERRRARRSRATESAPIAWQTAANA